MKHTKQENRILQLFTTFFKIGLFTFGGGYAMIPLIRREVVEERKWITEEDLLDITAIAESTPGPIAVNCATFVGNKIAGFTGSFAATAGVVLPSFVIIYLISFVLKQFESLTVVKYAFAGVRAAVLALIINALVSMYHTAKNGMFSYCIMAAAFILAVFTNISVIWIIAGCGLAGLFVSYVMEKRKHS